ncbi:MAG: hypothetical protein VYD87_16485 [Pseudomonadota bacterium]|nr:hypothetical protein [Pseudomonadota bacterium]
MAALHRPVPAEVVALCEEIIAQGSGYETIADAEAATIPVTVVVLKVRRWTASSRLGPALEFTRVASEPTHGCKLQTADGQWWQLANDSATPDMVGAVAGGASDCIAALERLTDWAGATGGEIVIPNRVYGISRSWIINYSRIRITGLGGREHNTGRSVILKMPGWTSGPAIKFADGLYSFTLTDVYVLGGDFEEPDGEGEYRPGDGVWIGQSSTVELRGVHSQNHAGRGMVYDGVWKLDTYGCVSRYNGDPGDEETDPSGGGIAFLNGTRGNANHAHFASFVNNNHGVQLDMQDGGGSTLRTNSVTFYGGQFEAGDYVEQLSILRIESGTRVEFYGTNFAQAADIEAPAFVIGSDEDQNGCDVKFFGGFIQHNVAGPGMAGVLGENIDGLEFHGLTFLQGNSKLFDASGLSRVNTRGNFPRIHIVGGNLRYDDVVDSAKLVARSGGESVNVGRRLGGLGASVNISSFEYDIPVDLYAYSASNTAGTYARFGYGASINMVAFQSMVVRHVPRSAVLPDLEVGAEIYWDGTGAAPDGGANGEGLYLKKSGGWAFIA